MDWETLKTKYPEIINIKTREQAKRWLKILSPEEQEIIKARWEISSEEKNEEKEENHEEKKEEKKEEEKEGHVVEKDNEKKENEEKKEEKKEIKENEKKDKNTEEEKEESEKDSRKIDQEQESELNDYKSLAENPPDDIKVADDFLEKHKNDIIPPEKVEKFKKESGLDLGGEKEIRSKPPINRLTAFKSLVKTAPMKIKEYFGLRQLNDEALPNIQSKNDELQKNIEKKWKLIQDELPEAKGFKTEDEFKKWASNLSPEQKKSLQNKWLASGNSGIISLNDAYAYKRVSELGKDNITKKTPNLIFKLYTQFFHPKPTTSAITKQGKTDQEYARQFKNQSPSVQKSILRHERKLAKREKKEGVAKKPESYSAKFKRMYSYLYNLKSTPPEYAASNVASQEYNKSKKNPDPIGAAVAVQELEEYVEEFAPPPPPYEPPPSYEATTTESPPGNEQPANTTNPTHSPSNLQQRLRNLQSQNNDNPPSSPRSSKYRKAARKLRKGNHKASKKAIQQAVKKKPWLMRIGPRTGCCSSLFVIIIVIFIVIIMTAVAGLIFGFL